MGNECDLPPAVSSNGIGWTRTEWGKRQDSRAISSGGDVLCCGLELYAPAAKTPRLRVINSRGDVSSLLTIYLPEDPKILRLIAEQFNEVAGVLDKAAATKVNTN